MEENKIVENNTIEKQEDSKELNQKKSQMNKKNKTILIIGGVIIALIIIAGVCAELFLFKDSKEVFEQTIIKVFDKIESSVEKYVPAETNLNEKDFSLKGDLSFDTTLDLGAYDDFKNYSLDYSIDFSLVKKIMKMNLGLKENNKDFIDANIFAQNEKMFIKIPELLSKTIDMGEFDWDENISITKMDLSKEDLKKIISGSKEMVLYTLDKNMIQETKNVNALGKTGLTEISYQLDEANQKRTLEKMIEYIKNNDEYLTLLSKAMSKDKETVIEDLEDELDNFVATDDITLKIYVEGLLNQPVGIILESDTTSMTVADNKIILNSEDAKLEIEEKDKELIINCNTDTFVGKVNIKFNEISSEKMSLVIELTLDYEDETYKLNMNLETNQNADVTKENISSAVEYSELTTEEIQSIYTKFFTKIKDTPFETFLSEMLSGIV